jgi:hypothetical protein
MKKQLVKEYTSSMKGNYIVNYNTSIVTNTKTGIKKSIYINKDICKQIENLFNIKDVYSITARYYK